MAKTGDAARMEDAYQRVVNEGRRVPMPDEYRRYLEDMYREEVDQLDRRLGGVASRWRAAIAPARARVRRGLRQ